MSFSICAIYCTLSVEAPDFDYSYDWYEYESSEGMTNSASARRELPENICEWTIEELDVSVRAYNCLKRAGIKTVADIVERGRDGLIGIRRLGKKNMDEVIQKIESLGDKIISEDDMVETGINE